MVRVSASYAGADADVLVDTVAAPIEQQVNGVGTTY
jgi:multidrug efflux pump subunit AcrB